MRYILLLSLLTFWGASNCYAQNNTLLQKPVSINVQQTSLHNIFLLITQQTGAAFSYSPQTINVSQQVSVQISNQPLLSVLKQLLGSSVLIKERGKYIILTTGEEDKKPDTENKNIRDINNDTEKLLVSETISNKIAADTVFITDSKKANMFLDGRIKKAPKLDDTYPSWMSQSYNASKNTTLHAYKDVSLYLPALSLKQDTTDEGKTTIIKEKKIRKEIFPENTEAEGSRKFQASFVYPLGSAWTNSPKYAYDFSFNIIGGITGGTNKLELAGIFNINHYATEGVQIAGVFNKTNNVNAAQIAGVGNIARYSYGGLQIAGLFNYIKGGKSATQIAGLANFSNDADMQVSILINVARESKVQIGFVNISDSANIMLGFINISKNGFIEAELSANEFLNTVSFRSGTDRLYGILSLGRNKNFGGWGYGLGTTFKMKKNWGINLDAMQYTLGKGIFKNETEYNALFQLRPLLYKKINRFKIFAGPVANFAHLNINSEVNSAIGFPYTIWEKTGNTKRSAIWVGFSAGVRFNFLK